MINPDRGRVRLTERKLEILRLIAEGKSDKEIMEVLSLGHTTVQYHLNVLRRYFGAVGRANLITCAFREGVLQ